MGCPKTCEKPSFAYCSIYDAGIKRINLAQVKGLPLDNVLRLVLDSREPQFVYVIKSGAVLIGPADGSG